MATRYFLWDDVDDCVLEEKNELGNTLVTYTHEPGPFGPLLNENRDGTKSYYHFDALGSTTMLTDDAGDVTDTFTFDAWGNPISRTGTTPTAYTWVGQWGYQDDFATTSGYYIRARSYQPAVARWMSVDPLFYELSQLAYLYSDNSPVLKIDGSGLLCKVPQCEIDDQKPLVEGAGCPDGYTETYAWPVSSSKCIKCKGECESAFCIASAINPENKTLGLPDCFCYNATNNFCKAIKSYTPEFRLGYPRKCEWPATLVKIFKDDGTFFASRCVICGIHNSCSKMGYYCEPYGYIGEDNEPYGACKCVFLGEIV